MKEGALHPVGCGQYYTHNKVVKSWKHDSQWAKDTLQTLVPYRARHSSQFRKALSRSTIILDWLFKMAESKKKNILPLSPPPPSIQFFFFLNRQLSFISQLKLA